ncbi:hypothetical protein RhiirA5_398667 [Rhizophagus irregularis]|uniref:Uncharacterized protein n=1 Tax=Rhizophagus irregularis TaxID=588596 RepID=A0A2N0RN85_9GLOM|nr:hypothetical protein RhiirA5_398667 [Rhizophagus irregularis]PKC64768.1 hypothetical protein RhiirA1_442646 [Rhizophagus irregularis]
MQNSTRKNYFLYDSNHVKAKEGLISFEYLLILFLFGDEKSSKPVEKFWITTKMEPTKLDYSMYALNQTIHEKKELFSYQNNNSDENPKSLDYDHDESDEIDNFFKSSSEKKSSSLFLQKTDNSSKKRRKPSNERGSNGADGEKDKVKTTNDLRRVLKTTSFLNENIVIFF